MSHSLQHTKDRISVLIITADNMTGELLKNAFAHGRKDFAVETLTGGLNKIVGEMMAHQPDVVLICEDLQDAPGAGIQVLRKFRNFHKKSYPIMLLQSSKGSLVVDAFREGARGVFYRDHSLKSLAKCIATVHEGQIWAGNEDLEHLISALVDNKPLHFNNADGMPLLTRREEEVVRLVAEGLKNREIALKLRIKEHSIRNYLYRIFDKLGVSTRVELILYAFSHRDHGT